MPFRVSRIDATAREDDILSWLPEDRVMIAGLHPRPGAAERSGLRASIEGSLNWDYIVQRSALEGLAGLLWRNLHASDASGLVAEPWARVLREHYHACLAANTSLLRELSPVLDELNRAGIPVLIFKGAALLAQAYENLGVRSMEDVDILLHEDDVPRATQLLQDMCLTSPPHHPALFQRGPLIIDAHTGVLNESRIRSRGLLSGKATHRIWEDAVPANGFLPRHARIPSPVHHFCILAAHACKHSFSRLAWLIDLHALISAPGAAHPWRLIEETAQELNLQKPVFYGLHYLRQVMGLPVPHESLDRLEVPRMGLVERRILSRIENNEPTERLGDVLLLCSMPRMRDRARLLWETIFPSRDVLAQVFPAGQSQGAPALYIARAVQILKLARSYLLPLMCKSMPRVERSDRRTAKEGSFSMETSLKDLRPETM